MHLGFNQVHPACLVPLNQVHHACLVPLIQVHPACLVPLIKCTCTKEYKSYLPTHDFKDAPRHHRLLLHNCEGSFADWRWETLEGVSFHIGNVFEAMQQYFVGENLEKALVVKIRVALDTPWYHPFLTMVHVVCLAADREVRWVMAAIAMKSF